jgi:hypothetical protein
MTPSRYISDPPRTEVYVLADGDCLRCSRKSALCESVVLPVGTPDSVILQCIWSWEAGFERGKEFGEHGLAKALRSLLRIRP